MSDNTTNTKLQSKRLKLRNSVYAKLAARYHDEEEKENQMVRHFYNRGEDAPIWVVFEILYLSDLAGFFECLNEAVRENILKQMNMFDISIDANKNSVAHNNIIFDTRFKDRKISPVLKKWVEKETGIQNITLYSLIDYIIIVCCLLKRVDFSGTRALTLLNKYKEENQRLQNSVASEIYDHIIQNNVPAKVVGLEAYLNV